jgi:hypothetical protein
MVSRSQGLRDRVRGQGRHPGRGPKAGATSPIREGRKKAWPTRVSQVYPGSNNKEVRRSECNNGGGGVGGGELLPVAARAQAQMNEDGT